MLVAAVTIRVSPSTLLGILRKGRLVVICAEPGYFSSELVKETLNSAIASDGRAFYRDCSSISGEAMSDTLSRLSRQITNKTRGTEDEVFAFIDWAAPLTRLMSFHKHAASRRC